MLVQEPLQAAIWHCLNHYDYSDATFLAERLFAEVKSDDSLHLLATCYYRSGRLSEALEILREKGCYTPQNKFLMAKCCTDMNRLSEAEVILAGDSVDLRPGDSGVDETAEEFGDSAAFALRTLASIYASTERLKKAADCERKALRLNPLLWKAFESLCNKGDSPDPAKVFTVSNLDNLNHCHGVNSILNLVNNLALSPTTTQQVTQQPLQPSTPSVTLTSTPNLIPPPLNVTPQVAVTPVNAPPETPHSEMAMDTLGESTLFTNHTPAQSNQSSRVLSGIATLNYTADSDVTAAVRPLSAASSQQMPPPMRRRLQRQQVNSTPTTNMITNVTDNNGPTPSFGLLPRQVAAKNDQLGPIVLRLDFSSPSLSVLSPCSPPPHGSRQPEESPALLGLEKAPIKQKRADNPLKPNNAFCGQSAANITPGTNQIVRRSSRLFSTQSVKENSSKAPTKKTRPPKSPSCKPKGGRQALSTQQADLAEKNEKNKAASTTTIQLQTEKESVATATVEEATATFKALNLNLGAHAVSIQKQSLEGLLQLLRHFGAGYLEMSKFNCQKAAQIFEDTPPNHRSSGWVLGMLGKAHFELAQYKEAKTYFRELRDREPFRLDFMEYFSTALWHLQDDVELSALAQDLTRWGKSSPQAWCAAGNCFSHLKEHENAIRFFQRAVQLDPSFAYAYTLLGHEYVAIEELDKALACFRSAVRMDHRHYNAWYGIGLTYYKQERYNMADIYYRKALGINKTNPILMCHVAVVQHAMQKTDKALETLNAAIRQSPKNSLCKFERASILFAAERYTEALEELNELKKLVPKESPVYFLLGKVHNKLNNTHMALMHFSWAMDLDPKGANSQIKDALDPTLNRAAQDDAASAAANAAAAVDEAQQPDAVVGGGVAAGHEEEMMQVGNAYFVHDVSEFDPPGGSSSSQESLPDITSPPPAAAVGTSQGPSRPAPMLLTEEVTPKPSSSQAPAPASDDSL